MELYTCKWIWFFTFQNIKPSQSHSLPALLAYKYKAAIKDAKHKDTVKLAVQYVAMWGVCDCDSRKSVYPSGEWKDNVTVAINNYRLQ